MRRGGVGAIASSPIMVGAVTTLIVILAVFLAYNANNGLPFVPSYRISVQVPNAETLVPGNDVRIGGVRVGFVEDVVPVQHEDGRVTAKADLKLDKNVDPIPVDSTVVVRAKSALGLKYLEINKGTDSRNGYPEGSTLPLKAANPHPVEYRPGPEHVQRARPGRRSARTSSSSATFWPAAGPRLNAAIGQLQPLLADLEPVARNLASKKTGLAASSASPATGRRGRPGRPDAGPHVRRPRHDLRRLRAVSPGRSSRTRSPRRRRRSTR